MSQATHTTQNPAPSTATTQHNVYARTGQNYKKDANIQRQLQRTADYKPKTLITKKRKKGNTYGYEKIEQNHPAPHTKTVHNQTAMKGEHPGKFTDEEE